MSWASKKYRWLEATKRAFKHLDDLSSRARSGREISTVELDELIRKFAELGDRGVQMHPGGGARYQRGVETKTLQIEAAIRLLRDVAERYRIPIVKPPKFRAPWVPTDDEGKTASTALDELRDEFGLGETEPPGMTDLMISPEAIDEVLDDAPQPAKLEEPAHVLCVSGVHTWNQLNDLDLSVCVKCGTKSSELDEDLAP